jgi:L-ascorbate metabolism protein UlaG (beta-lactamase superfamily)
MHEPVATGADLLAALADAPAAGIRLARLGQAGFVLRTPDATVVIDLYLSNPCEAVLPRPFDHRRATRAPLDPAEITVADLVLCTHDHLDHFDPPTLRSLRDASPHATLVLPRVAVAAARELDWPDERIVGLDAGQSITVAGVDIRAFAVAHDEIEFVDGHDRFLGYTLTAGGVTVAHVGDARSTPDLATALRDSGCDVALLPINGRSPDRAALGFAGNMNADEAVALAIDAGVPRVIAMHYDMFPQNTDDGAVAAFEAAAARVGLRVDVLPVGAPLDLTTTHETGSRPS